MSDRFLQAMEEKRKITKDKQDFSDYEIIEKSSIKEKERWSNFLDRKIITVNPSIVALVTEYLKNEKTNDFDLIHKILVLLYDWEWEGKDISKELLRFIKDVENEGTKNILLATTGKDLHLEAIRKILKLENMSNQKFYGVIEKLKGVGFIEKWEEIASPANTKVTRIKLTDDALKFIVLTSNSLPINLDSIEYWKKKFGIKTTKEDLVKGKLKIISEGGSLKEQPKIKSI